MTVSMIVGLVLLPFVWMMMAGANKQHIKEHGVPMPSRKAMARIRRNARQKGISQAAAYDQWIVNKRRRMPKGSLPPPRDNLVYNVSEAPKPRNWTEAFPPRPPQPVSILPERVAPAPAETGSPIVLWVVVVIAVAIVATLGLTSRQGSAPSPAEIAAPAVEQVALTQPAAKPAVAAEPFVPSQGKTTLYGSPSAPDPRLSVAALPSDSIRPPTQAVPTSKQAPAKVQVLQEDTRHLVGARWQVSGQKVPLRSEPIVGSPLVDRLGSRETISVLEQRTDWARVKVERTQKEGWIPTKRVGAKAKPTEPAEVAPKIAPTLPTAAIAKLLIAASIANYSGSCACPYQSDRGGRSCGRRSAYSRPGGFSPLCFAKDITPEMVAEYRRTH